MKNNEVTITSERYGELWRTEQMYVESLKEKDALRKEIDKLKSMISTYNAQEHKDSDEVEWKENRDALREECAKLKTTLDYKEDCQAALLKRIDYWRKQCEDWRSKNLSKIMEIDDLKGELAETKKKLDAMTLKYLNTHECQPTDCLKSRKMELCEKTLDKIADMAHAELDLEMIGSKLFGILKHHKGKMMSLTNPS